MEDNSKVELRDIYESAIVEGKIRGSQEAKREEAKKRVDGESGISTLSLNTMVAKSLARSKGEDETVASGIAIGLQCSKILYGAIGEEFLRKKLEEVGETFSQEEYSTYITEQMLKDYTGRKKEPIIKGIQDAINNRTNVAANAAKAGILVNELAMDLDMDESDDVSNKFENGEEILYSDLRDSVSEFVYGKVNPQEAERILDIVYQYFTNHLDVIDKESKDRFGKISVSKKIAYFISDLSYSEVEKVLKRAKEEKEFFE